MDKAIKGTVEVTVANCGDALLAHVKAADINAFLLHAHKVLLFNDDGGWFAQGLDIDHFAQGSSVEDVKRNYADSLRDTIRLHLETRGNLLRLTVPAPLEAWSDYEKGVSSDKLNLVGVCKVKTKITRSPGETPTESEKFCAFFAPKESREAVTA